MARIYFHTNLDLVTRYVSPLQSERVPAIGERFCFSAGRDKTFELEVVGIRNVVLYEHPCVHMTGIELHIPRNGIHKSIAEWEAHFRRHILNSNDF